MTDYFENKYILCVAHTPFQLAYLKNFTQHISGYHDFLIITTIKGEYTEKYIKYISSSIFSIFKLKSLLKSYSKLTQYDIIVLLPHLKGFISGIFYSCFKNKENLEFGLYYEGIALFRPPNFDNQLPRKRVVKRIIISTLFNLGFKNFVQAPEEFRKNAIAVSPIINNYLEKYSKQVFRIPLPFSFDESSFDQTKLIYVCHKSDRCDYILKKIRKFEQSLDKTFSQVIIKPHFESDISELNNLTEYSSYIIERNDKTLEEIVEKEGYGYFLFSHFSSLILNLKLMGVDKKYLTLSTNKKLPKLELNFEEYFSRD